MVKNNINRTICLVGCGKKKDNHKLPAAELYTSPFFRCKRQYAEAVADSWFILSAKHHLLAPGEIIAPYDETLLNFDSKKKKAWAETVASQLSSLVKNEDKVIILAGNDYFEYLIPLLTNVHLDIPLRGLRQGQQHQKLKLMLSAMEADDVT